MVWWLSKGRELSEKLLKPLLLTNKNFVKNIKTYFTKKHKTLACIFNQ